MIEILNIISRNKNNFGLIKVNFKLNSKFYSKTSLVLNFELKFNIFYNFLKLSQNFIEENPLRQTVLLVVCYFIFF
jgi:hypothetical protein